MITLLIVDDEPLVRSGLRAIFEGTADLAVVGEALRHGAAGFLLKRSRPEEIIQAVRTVAGGDSVVFPEAVRQLAGPGHKGSAGRVMGGLSAREKDVLGELAAGRNNTEIASALYLSPETVKTHIASVLAKMQVRDRTQAVILAYETGFITPGAHPAGHAAARRHGRRQA